MSILNDDSLFGKPDEKKLNDPSPNNSTDEDTDYSTPSLAGESTDAQDIFMARITDPLQPHHQLTGMYTDWFLDYASYVILERAVPHLDDGLKPVQRRILHSMKILDDGWYNKVANIIGHTMQFHPHGDASIGDALVQLGQKELLIDTQGNWGNILTGDSAAAPRYIEARLAPLALEVVYSPKTTEWMKSYDGRNQEPVTLPIKIPLLLAQGAEGIAVGLASKILPHNLNELLEAAVLYLKNQPFTLLPDFPTGALMDAEKYNDGQRGGSIRVRARIEKSERATLKIKEIPYGKDTGKLIESIRRANDTGKIRIRRIEDNTASQVEIVVHLAPDVSPDKTIDALYAFTDCEIAIWPNACVILDHKPLFLGVSDILKHNVERTKHLLEQELRIRYDELSDIWHAASLEKIFIENRIYLSIEECTTWEDVIQTIDRGLDPWKNLLKRPVTQDDIIKLTEIKIKRISKYDTKKNDQLIKSTEEQMEEIQSNLERMTDYTIEYFNAIRQKYTKDMPRRTEVTSFETIEATRVVANNRKLYVDRDTGFFGYDLKNAEYVTDCSDIDDILVICRDGSYAIYPIQDKRYAKENIIHISVYQKNNERLIYNIVYWDSPAATAYVKRCAITSLIREREYNLTMTAKELKAYDLKKKKTPNRILYLTANPSGEAETITVHLAGGLKIRKDALPFDFAQLAIRARTTKGNILTRHPIRAIRLDAKGQSTIGGLKLWFDTNTQRLNSEERGLYLGEFERKDRVLALYSDGTYQTHICDPSTRFREGLLLIEKFDPNRILAAAYHDSEIGFPYLKRFTPETSDTPASFIGESNNAKLYLLIDRPNASIRIRFADRPSNDPGDIVNVDDFIAIKSVRAKGKRLTNKKIRDITLLPQDPTAKDNAAHTPLDDEQN